MSENKCELIIENGVVTGYKGQSKVVEIPEGVTEIGARAFEFCDFIEEVEIKSKSLKVIGKYAFQACKNLRTFKIESLSSIEEYAFAGCESLQCFEVPNGTIKIGDCVFVNCDELVYISVPSTVSIIGQTILCSTNINTILLGKKGSEIATYANSNLINFNIDSVELRKQLLTARKRIKTDETKVITVYGQDVKCHKSISVYYNLLGYFKQLKDDFIDEVNRIIPMSLNEKSNYNSLVNLSAKYVDEVSKYMREQGVVFNEKLVRPQLLEAVANYKVWCDTFKECYEGFINITGNAKQKVYDSLMTNAGKKVTGLDYGVVGSQFDLFLHSIDDVRARRDQAAVAYGIAKADFNRESAKLDNQGNRSYREFLRDKATPFMRKTVEHACNKFLEIAFSEFVDAKIISKDILDTYDMSKSVKILNNSLNDSTDKSFAIAYALQYYPLNLNAYITAFKYDCVDSAILEIMDFIELYNDDTFKYLFMTSFTYGELDGFKSKYSSIANEEFLIFFDIILEEKPKEIIESILNGYNPENIDFNSWTKLVINHSEMLSKELQVFGVSRTELESAKGQKLLSDSFKQKESQYKDMCDDIRKQQEDIPQKITELQEKLKPNYKIDNPYKKLPLLSIVYAIVFCFIPETLWHYLFRYIGFLGALLVILLPLIALLVFSVRKVIKHEERFKEDIKTMISKLNEELVQLSICSFKEFLCQQYDN